MTVTENATAITDDDIPRRPPAPDYLVTPDRYYEPGYAKREMDHMWSRVWQLACLEGEVENVGDYVEYQIGPWSVLVVRESQGSLKAYHNVCLHRGRKIKLGSGTARELRCPYHAWTWSLDGQIKDVPERLEYCPFDDADVALREIQVDVWNKWVFVNLDPQAGPLEEFLAPVAEKLEPYDLDQMYVRWNRSKMIGCNWKNSVDAFNEAYHARYLHPEGNGFLNFANYPVTLDGDHSTMTITFGAFDRIANEEPPEWEDVCDGLEFLFGSFGEDTSMVPMLREMEPAPGQELRDLMIPMLKAGMEHQNIDVSKFSDAQLIDNFQVMFFPNVIINAFPFGAWVFRIRPVHGDPNSSRFDMWYFKRVADGAPLPPHDEHRFLDEGESAGLSTDQDIVNLPHQQAGMINPAFPGLRLSTYETRISHYHQVLDRYLGGR